MKYKLEDLIDIKKFKKLMEEFYNVTKIPHGLIDADGNILSGIGWQDVCLKFHRANGKSASRCRESDLAASNMISSTRSLRIYKCKNGLMEAAVPIIVEENYMGMLCLGQFLFEEPDTNFFRKQAKELGYDVDAYLEAVSQIPIFTKEKVESCMAYFFRLAEMISYMGLNQLKQEETENLLIKENAKLEGEQRNLRIAREYQKLKVEFFANLSHEFKTPLNLIHSTIQLLERELKDKLSNEEILPVNKRIKVLKQNTYRLLRLSNNILDITKIGSGYFEFKLENCNIVEVVEDITMSVAQYIKSKNIKVIFDTDIEEKIIAVDVNVIERIILNLLSNAVKFSKPGGEIIVKVHNTDTYVYISVKDTGIGIPQDKLQIIFDCFRQVNKSITRNHEGSGIGLSLVKLMVDLHNGEIDAKSKDNEGSEFIIKLPVKQLSRDNNLNENLVKMDIEKNSIKAIDIEFSDIYLEDIN